MLWNKNNDKTNIDNIDKTNDTKNTNTLRDNDEHRKNKKKRWGKNSTETIRDVYVCIDVARPRRKRIRTNAHDGHKRLRRRQTFGGTSARSEQTQQHGDYDTNERRHEHFNSKLIERQRQWQRECRETDATPIHRNVRNRNVSSSIKRSLSFMRIGGSGGDYDNVNAVDELSSSLVAPTEKMTSTAKTKSMAMASSSFDSHSVNTNDSLPTSVLNVLPLSSQGSNPNIVMSKSSITPPQRWMKKRVEVEQEKKKHSSASPAGHPVAYNNICTSIKFDSIEECDLDTKRLGVGVGRSNHDHHPQNNGRYGSNYGSDTDAGDREQRINETDDNDSAVSLASYSFNEEYNSVVIRILQEDDGEIILEYPDNNNDNRNDTPDHTIGGLGAPHDDNDDIDIGGYDSKPTALMADQSFLDDSTASSSSSAEFIPADLNHNNITPPPSPSIETKSTASISTATMATNAPRRRKRSRAWRDSDNSILNPEFELTSTTKQTEEDEIEKELIACFRANKESHLKLNNRVPDLILAEVDEKKNQSDGKVRSGSIDGSNVKPAKKFIFDLPHFTIPRKGTGKICSNHDTLAKTSQSRQTPTPPPNKIIKRLILSKQDEIHVSPCQCALSLVGMRGITPLDSQIISADDGESMFNNFFNILSPPSAGTTSTGSSFLKFSLFSKGGWGGWVGASEETDDTNHDKHVGADSDATSPLLKKRKEKSELSGTLSSSKREKDSVGRAKMVRTKSAQAADAHDTKTKDSTKKLFRKNKESIGGNWSLAKTESTQDEDFIADNANQSQQQHSQHLTVRRDNRWDYESVGYHEITLIRNRIDGHNDSKGVDFHAEEGFIDWDAVTIRCPNHDELDILVQSLKESSSATVIPFSSNPKEKLKKMNAMETVKCSQHTATKPDLSTTADTGHHISFIGVEDKKKSLHDAIEENSLSHLNINRDGIATNMSDDECDVLDSTQTKKGDDNKSQIKILASHPEEDVASPKKIIKKIPWDFNFNKKEYCELCNLYFTLLTRRHHCRQCERSCCSHCSSVLLVKGGGEKRYCNGCSADILRIQSEALHTRLRMRTSETVLPGKVHPACHRLGVGVVGKLPHWKNYTCFSADRRPAVGRLTVEVIEAMALPSVDKVNGIVDPYVRATITGYDRDLFWFLREWLPRKRFSMCSGYRTSTVSPLWHGCGRGGGERLTLPVISTAGAVLRLEVLHYNVLTNARGKDSVLGIVEIPLSDLPNANMRHIVGLGVESSKEKSFDGYCDRWYRLLPVDHAKNNVVVLSKPISSPHSTKSSDKKKELPGNKVIKSLEEIGKRFQGLCIAPVEWFASAIKLDLPARRPEAICEEHKARSTLHVRIKLNASHIGDLLSHTWFPPVKPCPSAHFDPQSLLTRIQQIIKLLAPYCDIFQYLEEVIKWKHETKTCLKAYFIFAFHMILFPHTLRLLHVYVVIFLGIRLRRMNADATDAHTDEDADSPSDAHADEDSPSETCIKQARSIDSEDSGVASNQSCASPLHDPSDQYLEFRNSPSLGQELNLNEHEHVPSKAGKRRKQNLKSQTSFFDTEEEEEDTAKLNKAVNWIAKQLGHNKGLDILQFKLTMLEREIRNINSVWDGSNQLLTQAAIACIIASFILHFLVRRRVLWLVGTSTWYFAQAPTSKRYARAFLGFWRGVAKTTRRQHLLDAEILEVAGLKPVTGIKPK